MMGKRTIIVALVGVNVLLASALLSRVAALPTARAQTGARPGELLCVTAKPAGQSYDVLYMLDVGAHKLHAFYHASPQSSRLIPVQPRDLLADFGKDSTP